MMTNSAEKDAVDFFRQCYEKYAESLVNFARARLIEKSDCSEDCVQEAFMVFYNRLKKGEQFEYPRAFLYRTLDRIIQNQRSKIFARQRDTLSLDDPNVHIELTAQEEIDYEKYIRLLENSLDEDEAYLYTEKYVNGKKIEQIANEANLSVGAVTMRLSRLRKKLKKALEDIIV